MIVHHSELALFTQLHVCWSSWTSWNLKDFISECLSSPCSVFDFSMHYFWIQKDWRDF